MLDKALMWYYHHRVLVWRWTVSLFALKLLVVLVLYMSCVVGKI